MEPGNNNHINIGIDPDTDSDPDYGTYRVMKKCNNLPELKRNLTAGTVFPDLSFLNHEKPAADSGGKLNIVCCEQD